MSVNRPDYMPRERPEQLSREDLKRMTPEQIDGAQGE